MMWARTHSPFTALPTARFASLASSDESRSVHQIERQSFAFFFGRPIGRFLGVIVPGGYHRSASGYNVGRRIVLR